MKLMDVWIMSSCHLTNPNWRLLWLSSWLLEITWQLRHCPCILGLLCYSSVSHTSHYTCTPLGIQDKAFPHPKYHQEIRDLHCFVHSFVFICRGCLSYTMVRPLQMHSVFSGLPYQTTWLWIFSLPTKCALLEMGDYQEIQREHYGLLLDFVSVTAPGLFEGNAGTK